MAAPAMGHQHGSAQGNLCRDIGLGWPPAARAGIIGDMTNEPRECVRLRRRGKIVELPRAQALMTLLDWLRLEEGATGTKEACAEGDCGACTVVLARMRDGLVVHEPVNSCILLTGQADGAEVITVEDLSGVDGPLHPVQAAMLEQHGSQCGFCTPGIVMSLYALHQTAPRPVARQAVLDALSGNLCRCTGYRPIVDAALQACAAAPARPICDVDAAALTSLDDGRDLVVGEQDRFFAAPASESVLAELYLRNPDAWLVAGATDIGLSVTKALAEPRKVIWLGRVRELAGISRSESELVLGAGVSLARAMPLLAQIHSDLGEVMRRFGSPQVRASGTVGGNIANASPIGDLAPCLIALGARVELARGSERRALPLEDFFLAYRKQDRRMSEYLQRVRIPLLGPDERFRAYKLSKRTDEDIAAVLAAFKLRVEGRIVAAARIACGGMAGVPARARRCEAALVGASLNDRGTWAGALDVLAADFAPISDHRASAAYRTAALRNLLAKALMEIAGLPEQATRLRVSGGSAHAG
jgi:xanthine dehydrogenase small subunit